MGYVEYLSQPVSTVDVDFNDDGFADCLDIDALQAEIVAGTNDPAFDLNGDSLVNISDRDLWLADAAVFNGFVTPYQTADFNLDRVVDVSDFGIWNGSKFTTNSAFCSGDATVDGVVDVSDFGVWNGQKFTSADRNAAAPQLPASDQAVGSGQRDRLRGRSWDDADADTSDDTADGGVADRQAGDGQMMSDRDGIRESATDRSLAALATGLDSKSIDRRNESGELDQMDVRGSTSQAMVVVDLFTAYQREDAADDRLRTSVIDQVLAEEVDWA